MLLVILFPRENVLFISKYWDIWSRVPYCCFQKTLNNFASTSFVDGLPSLCRTTLNEWKHVYLRNCIINFKGSVRVLYNKFTLRNACCQQLYHHKQEPPLHQELMRQITDNKKCHQNYLGNTFSYLHRRKNEHTKRKTTQDQWGGFLQIGVIITRHSVSRRLCSSKSRDQPSTPNVKVVNRFHNDVRTFKSFKLGLSLSSFLSWLLRWAVR